MNEKKKVIIIGAGVSGMAAGIYALENDFEVEIYEKHSIPGGECTGWTRKGVFIDGCAHWIVGTNPKSQLYPLWIHVGAFNEETKIYPTEYFAKFDINGEIVTFYSDLDKLKAELLRVAPEDEKQINKMVRGIRNYQKIRIPVEKPVELMNPFELIRFGISFVPILFLYLRSSNTSMEELTNRFKSPIIREILHRIFQGTYNVNSFYYSLQAMSTNDGGMVEGGSLKIALNMIHRFKELGGKIYLSSPVSKINIENGVAKSITLETGEEVSADYIISSCDMHHTLYDLLDNKYTSMQYRLSFENRKDYPLNDVIIVALKVNRDLYDLPKMMNFGIKPFNIHNNVVSDLSVRNHSFDKTRNNEHTSLNVNIEVDDGIYDYFKDMSREDYLKEKSRIGEIVRKEVMNYYKFSEDEIEVIDVTTPLTYERYLNAYRGSYMSFIATKKSKWLMHKQTIKGVKNLILSGQWIMPPGGLPIALFTGKHAAYRIAKKEGKKFVNKEKYNLRFAK